MAPAEPNLPCATPDLPGVGGTIRASPEDFEVEELPLYQPSGQGEHLYLWVEKRGQNTRDVVRQVARALAVREADVGVAGQKDRHALTRQFLSVPRVRPESARELAGDGWRVLGATLHGNKLRTGHLAGNRFVIRVRGCVQDAPARARTIAAALQERGLPNAYGPQRFGKGGANVSLGRALLAGLPEAGRARRDRFLRRMALSALQARLFNEVLARRMADGHFATALDGDLMKKLDTGGLFTCQDPAADGPRVARFDISPTGPMFGHRMMAPAGEALARERAVLDAHGLTLEAFAPFGGDAEGTRRPMRLPIEVTLAEERGALVLSFALPKGSYATVVLREILKDEGAAELPEAE